MKKEKRKITNKNARRWKTWVLTLLMSIIQAQTQKMFIILYAVPQFQSNAKLHDMIRAELCMFIE